MESDRFYVRRPNGKVFGPFDKSAVQMMLKSGKLGADAEVSGDRESWISITTVPDLARHVGGGVPGTTMTGVGGPDLPALKSGGGPPALPTPVRQSGGIDLPQRAGGTDLPAPSTAGLPQLSGSNLPTPSGGNLPTPSGGNLPTPSGGNLPTPLGGNLPAASGGNLPTPAQNLPSPNADLPGAIELDDDDLFDAPIEDEDDLFGAPIGGDDDDDLFGDDGDDMFGAPADEDDLFGPPQPAAADDDDDDLFGGPIGAPEGDLFEDDGPAIGGDDFLGGDDGFSFLDDEPPPADDWGDDLLDGGDDAVDEWGASGDMLDLPPPKPREKVADPVYQEHDPFRPMSQGIREDEDVPTDAPAKDKASTRPDDRKRGSVMMLGLPVLLLILGGVGYGVYATFLDDGGEVDTTKEGPKGPTTLALKDIGPDNYSDYTGFMDRAKTGALDKDAKAKLLVVQTLFLTRYADDAIAKEAKAAAKGFPDSSKGLAALARGAHEARSGSPDAARAYLEPLTGDKGETVFFAYLMMGVGDVLAVEKEAKAPKKKAKPAAKKKEEPAPEPAASPDAGAPADAGDAGGADAASEEKPEEVVVEEPEEEVDEALQALAERAERALKAAADEDKTSPLPHYWLGRLNEATGKTDDALKAYTAGFTAAKSHIATRLAFGDLGYRLGNLNDASRELDKIINEHATHAAKSENARAHYLLGKVFAARSESLKAIESFKKGLNLDPSRTDTLRALAEEYERAQMYKEALNFFTTNKNLGKKDPDVMLGVVRSHIGLEQWTHAITQLEVGQKEFPDDARFPFHLGQLNLKRGAFFDARKAMGRAVEIDPKLLAAYAALAQLAWRMDKDMAKGEEYVQRIVAQPALIDSEVSSQVAEYYYVSERRNFAEQWYRASLSKDTNYWPARLALSKLLLEERRHEESLELLERAREEGVRDIRLAAYLADAYRQAKRFDRAIDEINKVIEKHPKTEEYIFIRGRIYYDRGSFDTAREDFNRAYELNVRYHDAYFWVGKTAFAEGDHQTALKIFRHVLDYRPNKGDYRFNMGRALEANGQVTQALEEYRKATAVDPGYGIENPRIYIRRGRLLAQLGYSVEGRKDVQRALSLAPDMRDALIAMGDVEFRDKNHKAVIGHLEKALDMDPDDPDSQYKLGMSYLQSAQNAKGAERLQAAIKYGYKDPEIYKTLGYLYKGFGQFGSARKAFQEYLKQVETSGRNVPAATKREILGQLTDLGQ